MEPLVQDIISQGSTNARGLDALFASLKKTVLFLPLDPKLLPVIVKVELVPAVITEGLIFETLGRVA